MPAAGGLITNRAVIAFGEGGAVAAVVVWILVADVTIFDSHDVLEKGQGQSGTKRYGRYPNHPKE